MNHENNSPVSMDDVARYFDVPASPSALTNAEMIVALTEVHSWARDLPIPTRGTVTAMHNVRKVRDALAATPTATNTAGAVPEGWKLVPVEPTKAMFMAGAQHVNQVPEGDELADQDPGAFHRSIGRAVCVYMEMLAAAPSAPALAEPAPQWISVDERLPEFRHECTTSGCEVSDSLLIYGENAFGTTGCGFGHARDDGSWACYEAEYDQLTVVKVTHWMPLPSAPDLCSNQEKGE